MFVYEFVTGGGWYSEDAPSPPPSLAAEGAAMLQALVDDFRRIDGVGVDVMRDVRFSLPERPCCTVHDVSSAPEERDTLVQLAERADWSLVVAPEFGGHLSTRCRAVEQAGGRLLGPGTALVTLAADKHATAEFLRAKGIPAPLGVALAPGDRLPAQFEYPAVLKPRDGAGSLGVRLAESCESIDRVDAPSRLETFCRGMAASVACLCGPHGIEPLAPCAQRLSTDGGFRFQGGSLPLPPPLAARATRLAARTIGAMDRPLGYLGVDLVLGAEPGGGDDVVVEINPRITTSYVGLRALATCNLAEAMLAMAAGRQFALSWKPGPIQFEPNGQLTHGRHTRTTSGEV